MTTERNFGMDSFHSGGQDGNAHQARRQKWAQLDADDRASALTARALDDEEDRRTDEYAALPEHDQRSAREQWAELHDTDADDDEDY
jgi:hypothetical protein